MQARWARLFGLLFIFSIFANINQIKPTTGTPATQTQPAQPEARTWQNPLLIHTLKGHQATVEVLAFSPDGNLLVSGGGSMDAKIKIWNVWNGDENRTLSGHQTRVLALAFASDGQTLASGSDDSLLNIWNLTTDKLSRTFLQPATNITCLAITPNTQVLVSGGLDGLKLWDISTKRPLLNLLRYETVYSVAVSANGRLLASGMQDGTIKLWDLYTGKLITTFKAYSQPVSTIVFTPDSQIVIAGSNDGNIKLWNVETGELVYNFLDSENPITALAMNPDGEILASAGYDGIRLWNLTTHKLVAKLSGHSDWVKSLAFSPDGKLLASGGFDTVINIWQAGVVIPQPALVHRDN